MEPTNTTIGQKLGNGLANLKQMMVSDKRVMITVIVCTVLVIGFIVVLILSFSKPKQSEITTSASPFTNTNSSSSPNQQRNINNQLTASLLLQRKDTKPVKVNDTITFTLVGDSSGQTIRGYDAVFRYDTSLVSFIGAKNLFPTFLHDVRPRGNWILLTAVQALDQTNSVTFEKKLLMEIHFKAKKAGTAYFPMSFVLGRLSDSNLIDDKSQDVLTKASGITVQINP